MHFKLGYVFLVSMKAALHYTLLNAGIHSFFRLFKSCIDLKTSIECMD